MGYYGDPGFSYFKKIVELKGSPNILPWTRFDTDVAAGKLPNVSWIYAPGSPVELSEHPPYGNNAVQQTVKLGSQWTAERVHKLGQSKLCGGLGDLHYVGRLGWLVRPR